MMASLVGQGFVQIVPSMRGFRKTVDAEVDAAGRSGAKSFADRMKGAGAAGGKSLGQSLKSGFNTTASGLGQGATKALRAEIASASKALSTARLKQQDEAGKVRVAEARLAEAVAKSGRESAHAIAAEERLAAARRRQEIAAGNVAKATDRLKRAQEQAAATSGSSSASMASSWASGLRAMVTRTSETVTDIASRLANGLRNVATGVVATGAAAISAALVGGLNRTMSLEGSLARMEGLGFNADEIAAAMKIADEAAQGTSFAMNDLASAAAMAMTAGIKPGEQLVDYLDSIKGAATASGSSVTEIGNIFGKVATAGTAYTTEIQQLADRRIPIWKSLADVMGVPQDEVKKLASEGAIDLATFQEAVTAATGGMAEAMGNTLPAKIGNTRSALNRLGMTLIGTKLEGDRLTGGLYPAFGAFFDMLREGINAVNKLIGPFFEKWTNAGGEKLVGFFNSLREKFVAIKETGEVGEGAKGLLAVLGPLGGAFAALGAGGLGGLLTKLPLVGQMFGGLAGKLGMLGGPLGIAAAALGGFMLTGGDAGALADGIMGMVDQIVAALPGLISQVVTVVPQLVDGILSALPGLLSAGVEIIGALIQGVTTALPMLIQGALLLVEGLLDAVVQNLPMIIEGAVALVTALVQGLVTALPLLLQGALQLLNGLLQAIVDNLPMIIQAGIDLLLALVQGIVDSLPMLLEAALGLVMSLVGALVENLPLLIEAGIQLLLSLVLGLLGALPDLITAAIELVIALVTGLLEMLPELITAGIELVVALITGLVDAIPQIIEAMPQIIEAIWNAITEVDWLGLGVKIIEGLIEGIGSMVGAVGDAIGGLLGGIADFFPHSPAKKGPLSGRGYPGYSGRTMIRDFAAGMRAGEGEVASAAERIAREAAMTAEARARAVVGVQSRSGVPGVAGQTVIHESTTINATGLTVEEAVDLDQQRRRRIAGRT